MKIRARLLGFERETVVDDWVLPKAEFSLRRMAMRHRGWAKSEMDMPSPDIYYEEYELERVLGIDDGGPLAIYGRVR